MPSAKPFVVAYISEAHEAALQHAAQHDRAGEGYPGRVAVAAFERALRVEPHTPSPDARRPLRKRWLVSAEMKKAIEAAAKARGQSLSEWASVAISDWLWEERRREREWEYEYQRQREREADEERKQHAREQRAGEDRQRQAGGWNHGQQGDRRTQARRPKVPTGADYAALGLSVGATWAANKAAFKAYVAREHPDKGGTHERFVAVEAAYSRLKALHQRDAPRP